MPEAHRVAHELSPWTEDSLIAVVIVEVEPRSGEDVMVRPLPPSTPCCAGTEETAVIDCEVPFGNSGVTYCIVPSSPIRVNSLVLPALAPSVPLAVRS